MTPTERSRGGAATVTAWSAAALASAAAGLTAWLGLTGDGGALLKPILLTAVLVVPGVLISTARPRIAVGWLFLGEALLFGMAGLADAWIRHEASGGAADLAWAAWLTDRFSAFLAVGIWLLLVLLPDGRLPSPRWRPVVGGIVAVQCLVVAAFATLRGPAAALDTELPAAAREAANPVGVLPAGAATTVDLLGAVTLQLPLLLCLAGYASRLRRADPDERVRVVGVLLSASTFVLLVVLGHAWWPQAAGGLDVVAGALLAGQVTVTVLGRAPRLAGSLARQAFVYTVLTALVGAISVSVSALLSRSGQALPGFGIAVIAGATALAVHPLRVRLARLVDRLLHGDLSDPYRALQRLADRTHRAPTADAVLEELAASVAASLRVPWCAAAAGEHVGVWGERPAGATQADAELVSGTTRIGTLCIAVGPGRRLSADELGLLTDLGRHGGVAVRSALATDALRAGRQRVVVAREEERRRLRRDLHDEVGPTLAGLAMQLGTVRALVQTDPEAASERLARLQEAASGALETVRRVAHRLRPPALDELGLAGAVRQLAEFLGLRAHVEDAGGPRLPAAVEVAGYLIAAEALHNVARHAGTAEVDVSVREVGGEVVVRVRDSGAGVDPSSPAGVGLQAMRERADELGGTVVVDSVPGRGTTVTARLPAAVAQEQVAT